MRTARRTPEPAQHHRGRSRPCPCAVLSPGLSFLIEYQDHAGEITAHFAGHEFGCSCGCGRVLVSVDLVQKLEVLRSVRGLPVHVHDGFRCCVRQLRIDGPRRLRRSFHTIGLAADITIPKLSMEDLHRLVRECWFGIGIGGVGFYPTHVHVDLGPVREWSALHSTADTFTA